MPTNSKHSEYASETADFILLHGRFMEFQFQFTLRHFRIPFRMYLDPIVFSRLSHLILSFTLFSVHFVGVISDSTDIWFDV